MKYKLTKREYFRNLIISFKCEDCILFRWKKNAGGLFQIHHLNNQLKLKFDDQEVSLKADNIETESTIAISR